MLERVGYAYATRFSFLNLEAISANTFHRYERLQKALEAEQLHERQQYQSVNNRKTQKDRIEAGTLVWPAKVYRAHYSIAERIEVIFHINNQQYEKSRLRVGSACTIYQQSDKEATFITTLSKMNKEEIFLILSSKHTDMDAFQSGQLWVIEETFDQRPYRVMQQALKDLLQLQKPGLARHLRDGIAKNSTFDNTISQKRQLHSVIKLNESQTEAANTALNADNISVIHGPPGTGKTTTLCAIAQTLSKIERQVLVVAPSNNAVDLMAKKLNDLGLTVVRVGNIARIDDGISHLSLQQQVINHSEWKRIKQIKVEAEEARRLAFQHKRHYGLEEKRQRKEMLKEFKLLKKWAKELEERLTTEIISTSDVVATTLIGLSHKLLEGFHFQTVIVDEASQALEPEVWNAILCANRIILVGDPKQLPPVVKSTDAKKDGLEITLLDLLAPSITHSRMLRQQYRMNDQILAFSNAKFYDNQLFSDSKVANRLLPSSNHAVSLIDTSGCSFYEQFHEQNKSYYNPDEYFILREYIDQNRERFLGASIGIISPYRQQVKFIREQVSAEDTFKNLDVQVDTIDAFQGQEKDAILISLVRSNDQSAIGFLADERRLNVAMTRARKKLLVIGDFSTIASHSLYADLVKMVEERGEYLSAWSFMQY